jgi:hypothetical protein
MQTKCTAPSRGASAERIGEEGAECLGAHLARGHGELPVPAAGIGVAVDAHVIGRIEKGRVDPRVLADDGREEGGVAAVATADAVLAEDPGITWPRAGRGRDRGDDLVLGIGSPLEDHVDLAAGEAGQRDVDVDIDPGQLAELELQEVEVPAGAEGDPVVGQAQGALLGLRKTGEHDGRHLRHAERLRGEEPAVAGDDAARRVDQDRVGEPEGADRGGNLLHLLPGMCAGIAAVR